MKNAKLVVLLLLATFVVTGVAFAEAVSGKVLSVDPSTKIIKVSQADATGTEQEVSIWAQDTTSYQGITDLAGLQTGAKVDISAVKDEATGNWKAESIVVAAE